jgi:predicted membrane protein (TIGR00267 family)
MERARVRYIILGISDGLFLGIGLSLGISFFHAYTLTFASILLVGITGALSNMFATYNAEMFTSGQQLLEYKEALFVDEYKPGKLEKTKHDKSVRYAFMSFSFTLLGSLIVLAPYAAFYFSGQQVILYASITSLAISLIILGFIGSYNQTKLNEKIMGGLKTIGIGLSIAILSTVIGFLVSYLV